MKKLGLFILGFIIFFTIVAMMGLGALSAIYFTFCFIAWDILGGPNLIPNILVAVRIDLALAFFLTTFWIFTDGRKDWDV